MPVIRPLNKIEEAFAIMHPHHPFCVVAVLEIEDLLHGISWNPIRSALNNLQAQHPLLRARIQKKGGSYYFEAFKQPPLIPLSWADPKDDGQRQEIARSTMYTDFGDGPLMKALVLPNRQAPLHKADLLLVFHHAIMDSLSASGILRFILSSIGEKNATISDNQGVMPKDFSANYRLKNKLGFIGPELLNELRYPFQGVKGPGITSGQSGILSTRLSLEASRKLSLLAGRKKLSLNSVIGAAALLTVLIHRHQGSDRKLARYISFANLRSRLKPSFPSDELGCLISMMRFTIRLPSDMSLWSLAENMQKQIMKAARNRDHFIAADMAPDLVKAALSLKRFRLSNTALSFMGKLALSPEYGSLQLHDVRVYISNNPFGPELGLFGKILFGRIGLDVTYLLEEMTEQEARHVLADIISLLESTDS